MKKILVLMIILFSGYMFSQKQDLNPGDGFRVTFYNIPEKISGDYYIQLDGTVQFPYLGVVPVQNRTFESLKSEIFNKYDSLYKDPELTIQPLYKINILGEVRTPGFYYTTGVEKLSGLVALAGGETSDADIEDTYVIRDGKEISIADNAIITNGGDLNLQSGDRIIVPRRWWVGARNTAVIVSGAAVLVTLISIFARK
ncbi:MAG: polysaccharide biosynthesis/export family protein [Syntrophothermus sp.]